MGPLFTIGRTYTINELSHKHTWRKFDRDWEGEGATFESPRQGSIACLCRHRTASHVAWPHHRAPPRWAQAPHWRAPSCACIKPSRVPTLRHHWIELSYQSCFYSSPSPTLDCTLIRDLPLLDRSLCCISCYPRPQESPHHASPPPVLFELCLSISRRSPRPCSSTESWAAAVLPRTCAASVKPVPKHRRNTAHPCNDESLPIEPRPRLDPL